MAEYHSYQHIEQLGRDGTDGLLDGIVYVFPKLDGTNACVWRTDDDTIGFGSRRRELSENKDNAGFLSINSDNPKFVGAVKYILDSLGDVVIYGEWLVPHTLKTYEKSAWKRFYVFDVFDCDTHEYLHFDKYSTAVTEATRISEGAIVCIPPLWIGYGVELTEEKIEALMEENSYQVYTGSGEGIVFKRYGYYNPFGHTIWGKRVMQDFKEKHRVVMGESPEKTPLEDKIADKYLTHSLVDKEWVVTCINNYTDEDYGRLTFDSIGEPIYRWHPRYYPQLLGRVWTTFIKEEAYDFIKWSKNATIDFRRLYGSMTRYVKEYVDGGGLDG